MERLIRGILEFRARELPRLRARFRELAEGQTPDTLFITCSDSRVVPDLIVSTDPGELFVSRTVGNLVPPGNKQGLSVGDVSEIACIEYALMALEVEHLVVCGHSRCGAMKAVLDQKPVVGAPNLTAWLEIARSSPARLACSPFIDPKLPEVDRLSQANVIEQLCHTMTYEAVKDRVTAGKLHLHGWWFDVATGDVYVLDQKRGGFVLLDEAEGERVLSGEEEIAPTSLVPMRP